MHIIFATHTKSCNFLWCLVWMPVCAFIPQSYGVRISRSVCVNFSFINIFYYICNEGCLHALHIHTAHNTQDILSEYSLIGVMRVLCGIQLRNAQNISIAINHKRKQFLIFYILYFVAQLSNPKWIAEFKYWLFGLGNIERIGGKLKLYYFSFIYRSQLIPIYWIPVFSFPTYYLCVFLFSLMNFCLWKNALNQNTKF